MKTDTTDRVRILHHRPSGNFLFSNGACFVLKKGASVSPDFDRLAFDAISRAAHVEDVTPSGELTRDVLFFSVEDADFFVTGKSPTPESVAEWTPFKA